METITVKLLGNPYVMLNNKEIHFPYKKSEGLFYYICVKKKVTREEAANILWADSNDTAAKKNLRDALYKIKKTFCQNIFMTHSKTIIELNPDLNFNIDIDNLAASNIQYLYTGDFLENFTIKNCYDFEIWMLEERNQIRKIYTAALYSEIDLMIKNKDYRNIEEYTDKLIKFDPYNEKIYRQILKIYAQSGDYNKAVKLYYDLSDLLKKDLGISPEAKTKRIFEEILKLKDTAALSSESTSYFFGRYNEIFIIRRNIENFLNYRGISILIKGEMGIGKTSLINKISSSICDNIMLTLKSECYSADEGFFLKPWHAIFAQLGKYVQKEKVSLTPFQEQIISFVFPGFNKSLRNAAYDNVDRIDTTRYELTVETIIELFEKLTKNKKIILIFDDIQWMDKNSRILLSYIIYHFENKNVMFIGSYRDDFETKLSDFLFPLINKGLIEEIELSRFSFEETKHIAVDLLPKAKITASLLSAIYNDTEGNPLFLSELLKVIQDKGYTKELSTKSTNIIKSRIADLSKKEKLLLNIISIFFDKVSIESLKQLVHFDELEIFDLIESLQEKHLIQEVITEKDIFYSFTHQKIREYIYNKQSKGKKRILHKKIADYFEECFKLSGNKYLYPNLIYHLKNCGDMYRYLKYKVENLTDFYTIYHETYPIILSEKIPVTETEDIFNVEDQLLEIFEELNSLDKSNTDFLKLKMEISYLAGRYYISMGEYEKGLDNIYTSMNIAENLDNFIYLMNNFKQMIFYSIQINDTVNMNKYINKSLKLLEKNENIEDRAIILRLKGLYCIKTLKYDDAIIYLNESLNIFSNLNKIRNNYILNISACYSYLGLMYNYKNQYETAYNYFEKSIDLCKNNQVKKGLEIFLADAGEALFKLDKYDEAEKFIYESLSLFEKHGNIWGRDMAEAYASLIQINKNDFKKGKQHFEKAYELAKKLNNPRSIKLLENIKNYLPGDRI